MNIGETKASAGAIGRAGKSGDIAIETARSIGYGEVQKLFLPSGTYKIVEATGANSAPGAARTGAAGSPSDASALSGQSQALRLVYVNGKTPSYANEKAPNAFSVGERARALSVQRELQTGAAGVRSSMIDAADRLAEPAVKGASGRSFTTETFVNVKAAYAESAAYSDEPYGGSGPKQAVA